MYLLVVNNPCLMQVVHKEQPEKSSRSLEDDVGKIWKLQQERAIMCYHPLNDCLHKEASDQFWSYFV